METLSAKRPYEKPTLKIVSFYNESLENYLLNFDISHDVFDETVINTDGDKFRVRKYYDSTLEKAERLVLDSEFVGITFANLSKIYKILKKTI